MIELKSIKKSFGSRVILDDISLDIYPDEITFITGTSGAGKTTLLNIIGGLLNPDSGRVLFNGENVSYNLDLFRSKNVGFIFQDFNLINGLSAIDNIKLGSYYSNSSKLSNFDEAQGLLKDLEIINPNQKVETLSGGEKQRIAFARSIVKKSSVIIADEPTGNLDSKNAQKVLDLLKENKKDRHVIVVSHDKELAKKYADRIVEISDGKIVGDSKLTNVEEFKKIVPLPTTVLKNAHNKANFILGINNVKRKIGKIMSIVLAIGIAICSLALVFNMTEWGNSVTNHMNKYYLETDLISLTQNKKDTFPWYFGYPFSTEQLDSLNNEYKESIFVPKYIDGESQSFLIGTNIKQAPITIKQILLDKVFEERVSVNDIEGSFPKKDDEIILAEDVATSISDSIMIGEQLTIYGENGGSIVCTVVGINHTKNALGSTYTFVSNNLIKRLYEDKLQKNIKDYVVLNEADVMNGISFPCKISEFNSTNPIVVKEGHLPTSKTEVLISSRSLEKELGSEWSLKINEIFERKYYLDLNGRFELKIVGVYESTELEALFDEELIKDILVLKPVCIDIYLSDIFDTASEYNKILEEGKYFCTYKLEQLKKEVNGTTSYFKIALIVVGIILTIISIALLNSYAKITVLERKHELAIIRCLGASNRDLRRVLLFDSAVISIIAIIFSMIATFVTNIFMPNIFSSITFIDFSYPWVALLSIGAAFFILSMIVTLLHFIKISRTMPADLLKDN